MPDRTQVLRLDGPLTMTTVRAQVGVGRSLAAAGSLVVDFAAVTEADSAALALLFDWLRTARAAGHELSVSRLQSGLRSLATLYGVEDLLPPEREAVEP